MGETMELTQDRIEEIAREVYKSDRFTPTDQVWCNLHWLTLFAKAIERETSSERDREIERLEAGWDASEARFDSDIEAARADLERELSASQAREREAVERAEKAEHRIAIMREGILEARREGCACDFHLYGEDQELDTPEALDAYCTLEARNTKLECEGADMECALAAARKALEKIANYSHRSVMELKSIARTALNGDSHD